MTKLTIIAKKDERTINWLGRARKETKARFQESLNAFNQLVEKLQGKEIEITRINQALEVYSYSHATSTGCPPAYWTASLERVYDSENSKYYNDRVELKLNANYRNVDTWNIL